MDHMWEAPSRLKNSLSPIILKKLAIILRQDFLRTLYISEIMLLLIVSIDLKSFLSQLWP